MACDCIQKIDAMLAEHNTRVMLPIMLGEDRTPRVMIVTDQIQTGRGKGKAKGLFATYCPFCGTPYKGDRAPSDFLDHLRAVNGERYAVWSEGTGEDPLYLSNELGGEAGEVLNVVKKLVREERGWRGSRTTVDALAEEIADCVICLDNLSRGYGIDIKAAVIAKFNKTSAANGFEHRLSSAEA